MPSRLTTQSVRFQNCEIVYEAVITERPHLEKPIMKAKFLMRKSGNHYWRKIIGMDKFTPSSYRYLAGIATFESGGETQETLDVLHNWRDIEDVRKYHLRTLRLEHPMPYSLPTPFVAIQPLKMHKEIKPNGKILSDEEANDWKKGLAKVDTDLVIKLETESAVHCEINLVERMVGMAVPWHKDKLRWEIVVGADGFVSEAKTFDRGLLRCQSRILVMGEWNETAFPKKIGVTLLTESGEEEWRIVFNILDVSPGVTFEPEQITIDRTQVGRIIDRTKLGNPETVVIPSLEMSMRSAAEQAAKLERKAQP